MTNLSIVGAVAGGLHVALGALLLARPSLLQAAAARLPRDVWAGRLLALAAMVWTTGLLWAGGPWEFQPAVTWLMARMGPLSVILRPLQGIEDFKPALWVIAPLSYVLIVRFVDELLAARAVGGLLLLAAAPLLGAARWEDTPWRLVVTGLAYAWAIAGIALSASPYRFRLWSERVFRAPARTRATGAAALAFGLLLLGLALTVYAREAAAGN